MGLQTVINNIGTTTAPTSTLAFHRAALTGTLAVTDTIPALAAGESVTITTPWNFGSLVASSYSLVAAASQSGYTETFPTNNVYTSTLDVLPDVMVSPYYLWSTPLTATAVVVTATLFNIGPVTATNVTVGFYRQETLVDRSLLFSRTIPLLAPAESQLISAPVSGPLGCGVFVQADPLRQLAETTRTSNLASIVAEGGRCASFDVYLPTVARSYRAGW